MLSKKRNRTLDNKVGLLELICPITLELPIDPVMAQDGKVYEKAAWDKLVANCGKKKRVTSPWTSKPISKLAYESHCIKNLIEYEIRNGNVSDEFCASWKQRLDVEMKFKKLVKDAARPNPDPALLMMLGDNYNYGTGGAYRNEKEALACYRKGASLTKHTITPNSEFKRKIAILDGLRLDRSKTDMICAWSTMCQLCQFDIKAMFTIKVTLGLMPDKMRETIAEQSKIEHLDFDSITYPNDCNTAAADINNHDKIESWKWSQEMAGFLKENSQDKFNESSDESESDESDASNE